MNLVSINTIFSSSSKTAFTTLSMLILTSCLGVGKRQSHLRGQSPQEMSIDSEKPSIDEQGFHIIEGDILVSPVSSNSLGLAGAIKKDLNELWSNGTVFYRFNDKVSDRQKKKFSEVAKVWEVGVNAYLRRWDSSILIRFVEDKGRSSVNALEILGDQTKNSSFVGMLGGVQSFRLRPKATRRAIGHELGHALGLPHEHTRCDRKNYIAILYDNISKEAHKNFTKKCKRYRIVLNEYSVNSIMHYSHDSFSINGSPTMVLKSDPTLKWEQPDIPSELDFRTVAMGYMEQAQAD